MISDELFALAFAYKKTKLWECLWDTCIFALKLSDGQIGYISVMGSNKEFLALGLYIGDRGFQSLKRIVITDPFLISPAEQHTIAIQQECLQCAFEKKDELSEEEREEAKKYARAHGIRIAGKNAYPQFVKYQPYYCPWRLQDEKDQEYLCEALCAAIYLAGLLKEKNLWDLGLTQMNAETREIPLMEPMEGKGTYYFSVTPVPEGVEEEYPTPIANNEIGLAKLKKLKKSGVWECSLISFPNPIQEKPDEVPYFPAVLLAVNADSDYILPISPVSHYKENAKEQLEVFLEALLMEKIHPKVIKVRDQRTYAFMEDFCKKLGITLRKEQELFALEDAEASLFEHFGGLDEAGEEQQEQMMFLRMLTELMELSDEELYNLPKDFQEALKEMMGQGILPDEVIERLSDVFSSSEKTKGKTSRSKKKKENRSSKIPAQSYVISVSVGTGCYRHIQISNRATLLQLSSAILNAFEFFDDHAHAFFMDNRIWSEEDCYYVEGMESDDRTTDRYQLFQMGFYKGMAFKYVFDFGDEWVFQCKILKIVEGETERPVIVRTKGNAPEQYQDWDDEDWDDDDD